MGKTKKKYVFSWGKFVRGFWLWLISIPINFLPLLIRHIADYEKKVEYEWTELLLTILCDLDFLFVFLCALFVLYLQGEYTTDDCTGAAKICKRLSALFFAPLLILVLLLYAFPMFCAMIYKSVSFEFNMAIMIVTILLSALSHAAISMEKGEE